MYICVHIYKYIYIYTYIYIYKRKANWIGHILRRTAFYKKLFKER